MNSPETSGFENKVSVRFWAKVNKDGLVPPYRPDLGPCWLWTGTLVHSRGDYGQFWRRKEDGGSISAHRFAYEEQVGPIDKPTLDHLCRIHACIRPTHLEPATQRENVVIRGTGITAQNARKVVHPVCGGEYSVIQTGPRAGMRYCASCIKDRNKARQAKRTIQQREYRRRIKERDFK